MKTVITSEGSDKNSIFDLRFGRAVFFCVYDDATGGMEFIKNEYADAQGGVGTSASKKMLELGVQKVISGDFGPKAIDILERFKVQLVIMPDDNNKIVDIVDMLKAGVKR